MAAGRSGGALSGRGGSGASSERLPAKQKQDRPRRSKRTAKLLGCNVQTAAGAEPSAAGGEQQQHSSSGKEGGLLLLLFCCSCCSSKQKVIPKEASNWCSRGCGAQQQQQQQQQQLLHLLLLPLLLLLEHAAVFLLSSNLRAQVCLLIVMALCTPGGSAAAAATAAAAAAATGTGAAGVGRGLLLRRSPLCLQEASAIVRAPRFGMVQQQMQQQQLLLQQQLQSLQLRQQGGGLRERLGDFTYRWLDVTGFLTRWHSRKAWVLDLDPYSRLATPLITEYERKMLMFMGLHAYLFFFVALYLAAKGHAHGAVKPPVPSSADFCGLDGRKKDFTWHGRLFFISPKERCKECRWLDLECKKACFDTLKAQGHKLWLNGGNPLSVPRETLHPPHSH
ncbi:hypothetical protein Efla_005086 [Eimeria flavescens]